MEHEEALIRAFVVPERRAQYLERLASPKTRHKFMTGHFHHMRDLDPRYAERLDPHRALVAFEERADAHVEKIYELLCSRGARERCYVMSASSDLDQQEADLRAALAETVGYHAGTFISCVPGRLAYFEGEEPNERYILQR